LAKLRYRTIGIFSSDRNSGSRQAVKLLQEYLEDLGVRQVASALPSEVVRQADLVLVLGGDGTLLHAAHHAAPLGKPLLGINLGRLGYLASVSQTDMLKALGMALKGHLAVDARVMLSATVRRAGKPVAKLLALNDMVITKGAMGRIVELDVFLDGTYLTSYKSDGLIVATPTGSTAYALSAGGPILHPRLRDLVLAPISPHTLSNRPLVLPDSSHLEIVIPQGIRSILVSPDGRAGVPLKAGDRVEVSKARETTRLLVLRSFNYWEVLRSKLGWKGN
jgi:NAD+ kinase